MSERIDLKHELLSRIGANLLPQIKLIFIRTQNVEYEVVLITKKDQIYGFGANINGRLGFGHNKAITEPTLISELCSKNVIDIQFGENSMIALTHSGDVYSCGFVSQGRFGFGARWHNWLEPHKIDFNNERVFAVETSAEKTYLLSQSFELYWFGKRGWMVFPSYTNCPTFVDSYNHKIVGISSGIDYCLALTEDGKVYAQGDNRYGQLGLGHEKNADVLELINLEGEIVVQQVSCGDWHSLLLTKQGQIFSIGYNESGQLGTGNKYNGNKPAHITEIRFKRIFAFDNCSMALSESNKVFIWGETKVGDILEPFETNLNSIQEAILYFCKDWITYEPLTIEDIKPKNRIMITIAKAFNDPKTSDLKFKLKLRGREEFAIIYVHKWFLGYNCEYFERMFANDWSESKSNEIEIKGYSYEAYYQFIGCLYNDYIETKDIEILIEMILMTDEYLDSLMKTKCLNYIQTLLSAQNACSLYSKALEIKSKELEEKCLDFITKNIKCVKKTLDWERMDNDSVKQRFEESTEK